MSDKCQFEQCHAILKNTKADDIMIDKSVDAKTNILMFLKKTSYKEFKDNSAFGLNFPLPVENAEPIMVGVDMSEDNYNQMKSAITSHKVLNFSTEESYRIVSRIVNPTIYKDWLDCMKGMMDLCKSSNDSSGEAVGLKYSVERNYKEIIIKVRYLPFNSNDPYPIITSFNKSDVMECDNDCLEVGMELNREFIILFKRVKPGAGTIIIGTDKGGITIPVIPNLTDDEKENVSELLEAFLLERYIAAGGIYNKDNDKDHTKIIVRDWTLTETILDIKMTITKVKLKRVGSGAFAIKIPIPISLEGQGKFDLTDLNDLGNKICFDKFEMGRSAPKLENFGVNEFCIQCFDIANQFYKAVK